MRHTGSSPAPLRQSPATAPANTPRGCRAADPAAPGPRTKRRPSPHSPGNTRLRWFGRRCGTYRTPDLLRIRPGKTGGMKPSDCLAWGNTVAQPSPHIPTKKVTRLRAKRIRAQSHLSAPLFAPIYLIQELLNLLHLDRILAQTRADLLQRRQR